MVKHEVTCTAPVNIAVIKYWGKRDSELNLPVNSSVSLSLDQNQLRTTTTVVADSGFDKDRIWLNGTEEPISNVRLQKVLREMRARANQGTEQQKEIAGCYFHIISVNNFPTAAGLASSASGYACLVSALAKLLSIESSTVSAVARVGSGSACRSMYGGWVKWVKGERDDGSDSVAVQLREAKHWPGMRVMILVASQDKKEVSSTAGMGTSVATSALLKYRAEKVVPERTLAMEKAIAEKDFQAFGQLTMQDSNQFHAICLDTYPPIFYLSAVSRVLIGLISQYNTAMGSIQAAYTFDAGPNAVVYLPEENVERFVGLLRHFFPCARAESFFRGLAVGQGTAPSSEVLKRINVAEGQDGVLYAIHTQPGLGPQTQPTSLATANGLPL